MRAVRLSPLPAIEEAGLNPGIRRTVAWLRERGFDTCDSGDGATHEHPCDRPYPYVAMRTLPVRLVTEAHRLVAELARVGVPVLSMGHAFDPDGRPTGVAIQASYDPGDGVAVLDLVGLDDARLPH